jgi:hypothetical protein
MTAITERPYAFRAEMVRAILDGRKTQMREVVKSPCLVRPARRGLARCGWTWYGRQGVA